MKKMTRSIVAASLFALAACGGPQTSASTDTTTDVEVRPSGPVTPQVTGPTPEELAQMRLDEAAAAFTEAGNIFVSFGDRDLARAERLLQEAMEKNPEYTAEAWFNIGLVRYEMDNEAGALEAYAAATAADPLYARGLANTGYIQMMNGDYRAAESTFMECIGRLETEAGCNVNLALLYDMGEASATGDVRAAMIERIRFALGGGENTAAAYALLSEIYYEEAKYDLARLVCENAILIGVDEAVLHNRLGLISLQQDNVIEAYQEFQRAVELDPSLTEAWSNIGAMALSFRDYDAALNAFEQVLAETPDDLDVRLSYGAALRGVDAPDEAEAEYQAVLAAEPGHLGALFNMALLYQEAKQDYPGACGYYRQYLSSAPSSATRYEDATRRMSSLYDLLSGLIFLGQLEDGAAEVCAR